jgi:nitroreductase
METVTAAEVLALVQSAMLAPSSHNTQPWMFRLLDDGVELVADRTRALPVNDPHDRELTISCGAALFNLRLAAVHAGYEPKIELLPEAADTDLIARIRLIPKGPGPDTRLYEAIGRRHTTRRPFDGRPVPDAVVVQLQEAATAEGVLLEVFDRERREALVGLVAAGDRAQFGDPRWRRELAAWIRSARRGDGLTVPLAGVPFARFAVRSVDLGRSTTAKDRGLATAAPVLAVLATASDGPHQWLAAGEGLQHLLLVAALHGVQAGYLNQPCQVAELRTRLRDLLPGRAVPQVVLRLGYPPASLPPAPRRAVEEVVQT